MKESDVNREIKRNLKLFCPQVVNIIRIFTGKVEVKFGGWVHGADKGTSDWVVIVNNEGCGHTLFIETKRPGGGRQSDDQKIFKARMSGMTNIHYLVVRSVHEIVEYIREKILNKSLADILK